MTLIALPDGRQLDIAVSGPPGGVPLIYHHGTPGAVPQSRVMQRDAWDRGLRLVTFSRPGYGNSTRKPGRAVLDVAADVEALLDHLEADRCLTLGHSGGGPHALATAAALPGRVAGVATSCSLAPYDAPGFDFLSDMGEQNIKEFGLALRGEAAVRPALEADAVGMRRPDAVDAVRALLASLLSDRERAAMSVDAGAGPAEEMAERWAHGLRDGVDGWVDDDLAFVRPWGFDPVAVQMPCFIWHGAADRTVPPAHGRRLADQLPDAVLRMLPGKGHLMVQLDGIAMMADELLKTL
ncbi:alpha/beta hydrolase [Streptomyces sp. NPDC046977]|uniref:alpha/beta fold hydrolase n=1 Tax=Streptomyces sp. NPDC046977 TaxID=3154703 RepID=UPI0033C0EC1C